MTGSANSFVESMVMSMSTHFFFSGEDSQVASLHDRGMKIKVVGHHRSTKCRWRCRTWRGLIKSRHAQSTPYQDGGKSISAAKQSPMGSHQTSHQRAGVPILSFAGEANTTTSIAARCTPHTGGMQEGLKGDGTAEQFGRSHATIAITKPTAKGCARTKIVMPV